MVTTGALYIANTLLATGRCSLLPDEAPTTGTLVGGSHRLLKYEFLTLVLADDQKLTIAPKRIEFSAGEKPLLVFDVLG
jgi:hypothetical protein